MWNYIHGDDQIHTNSTKNWLLIPDFRQAQTPPDFTTVSLEFLATRVATLEPHFSLFPNRTNGALVELSVTVIGYYFRSKLLFTRSK